MKLVIDIPFLGLDILRIKLDIEPTGPTPASVVDKSVKWIGREYFNRLIR